VPQRNRHEYTRVLTWLAIRVSISVGRSSSKATFLFCLIFFHEEEKTLLLSEEWMIVRLGHLSVRIFLLPVIFHYKEEKKSNNLNSRL
jgi:hypothetical protein